MSVQVKVTPQNTSVATGVEKTVTDRVIVNPGDNVALDIPAENVTSYARDGADLIVQLKNGDVIRVVDFYGAPDKVSHLYLVDDQLKLVSADLTAVSDGTLSVAYVPQGVASEFASLSSTGAALGASGGGGLGIAGIIGGIALAGGGVAALAGGGGGNNDAGGAGSGPPVLDTTPPGAATGLAINAPGSQVTGNAEAGATVLVDVNGDGAADATGTAGADGRFTVTLPTPLTNGQTVTVTVRDPAGNVGPAATTTAPDTTPPAAATGLAVSADGATVTGQAEAGATVGVDTNGDGVPDATATTGADGRFTVTLPTPLTNGETVSVIVTDPAGNSAPPATVTAPDTTAPAAATGLMISADGATLSGVAEAGATIGVDVNGDGVNDKTGTVGADGTFQVALDPPLIDGRTITVAVTDPAGNVSGPATVTAPDTTPVPLAPIIDPSNGVTVTGDAQPGFTVTVTDGSGGVLGSVVVAADGSWSFTPAVPLADGTVVTAYATDGLGTQGPSASVIVDAVAPDAPSIAPSNGTILTGLAEAGSTISISANGGVIGTATTGADGRWTFTPSSPLGDNIVVSVTASDAAGNASPAATTTTDAVPPAAPVVTPSNGTVLTGTAEPGGTVTVLGSGGTVIATVAVDAAGNWAVVPSPALANGAVVSVSANDAVGNVGAAATITIDAAAPAAPQVAPSNGVVITGTAEAGSIVTLADAGGVVIGQVTAGANGGWSFTPTTPLADGSIVLVRAADAVGNVSGASAVTIDAVAPTAPVVVQSNGTVLTGTAEAGSIVTLTDGGGVPIGQATTAANGTWSFTPAAPLADGVVVSVSATDAAGNVGPAATVTIDAVAPGAPAIAPSNGAVLVGTAEAGSTITLTADGVAIGQVVVDANGNWTFSPAMRLADDVVVNAVATDAAGNASVPGTTIIDATLPSIAVIAPSNGTVVSGTADPGNTVTLTDGSGALIGQAVVDANGNWSVVPAVQLADGTTVSAVATNMAGVSAAPSIATIDGVAPIAPTIDPSNGIDVTGVAEAGATLTLTDGNGAVIGTTVVAANGSWSFTPATPLADGATVSATATDAAGNASLPSTTTIDATAPAAPVIAPTGGVVVSGTTEAGALVTVTDANGTVIGTAVADGNGNWNITPAQPLADGATVSATATDAAGNASPVATATVDAVAPAAPAIGPSDGAIVTGTAEAGAMIALVDGNGTPIGQTTADGTGNWSFTPTTPLADGTVISAVAIDAAGNQSPAAATIVDGMAPFVTLAASAGTDFAGTAEPGSLITLTDAGGAVIGQTTTAGNGSWSISTAVPVPDGTVVSAIATDAAGNASAPATTTVDGVAPGTPTIEPSNGSILTGTAEANAVVTLTDNNGAPIGTTVATGSGMWIFAPSPALADGTVVSATASDAAGNVSGATTVTVDAVAPAGPVIAPTDGTIVSGTAEAGATVILTEPGGAPIGSVVAGANGAWSFTPAAPLADGTVVNAVARDPSGNTSVQASATVDAMAPPAPVVDPSNGVVISGMAEAGATITLSDGNGTVIGTATVGANGSWSIAPPIPLADGTIISAIAVDATGNASVPASSVIDALAPLAPVIAPSNGAVVFGTAEAGATLTLTDGNGAAIGTVVVNAQGGWSFTPPTSLANGTVVIAVATDAAGNASPSASATIDSVAPIIPAIDPTNGVTITGTAEAGATITLVDGNGAPIGSVVADGLGAWAFTPGTALANGVLVVATATDATGNVSGQAASVVDAIAPGLPTIVPSNGVILTGTAEAGATVTITDSNGTPIGVVTADANGNWSLSPAIALPDLTVVNVVASDAAGNASGPASLVIDAVAPLAPVIAASNGIVLAGTAEANSLVTVSAGGATIGQVTADANGNWSFAPATPLADTTVVTATATDAAGNVSGPGTVTIDGSLPSIPMIDPSNGTIVSGTADIGVTVTVTDGGGAVVGTVVVDANGNWSITPAAPLADGTVLTAIATNAFNVDSAPVSTIVDAIAPAIPTVDPSNGVALTGMAEAGVLVTLTDQGGAPIGAVTADVNGNWSLTPTVPLANGVVVSITATDAAGNTGPAASVTIDAIAPAIPVINPTNGAFLAGTAEAGALVTLTDSNGAPLATVVASGTGAWTFVPAVPLADSTVVSVTATDAAGNVSGPAVITVDAIAPGIPTALVVAADGTTLTGLAEANSQVRIIVDGDVANPVIVTANAQGSFTATFATPVDDGQILSVTATDAAGNVSLPGTAFAPDLGVPLLTIGEAADGYINAAEISNGIQVSVGLTASTDPGDTLTVTFAGTNGYVATQTHVVTAAEALAGSVNLTLLPPQGMAAYPEGTATISASIDGGPASLPATFIVDTIPPATPVLSLAANLLTISGEPGSELTVNVAVAGTTATATVTADNTGLASLDLLTGLDLGLSFADLLNASVSVRGADEAGNLSNVASLGVASVLNGSLVTLGNFDVNAALLPPTLGFSGTAEAGSSVRVEVVTPAITVIVDPQTDANGNFSLNLLSTSVLSQLGLSVSGLLNLGAGLAFNVVATDAQGHDSARYGVSLTGSGLSLDLGQITVGGTGGSDVLSGSNGSTEVINGGAGSDLILNVGTGDRVDAGIGDDTIQLAAANFGSVDGGAGFDTVLLSNGIDIDYNGPGIGSMANIERIDLGRGDSGSVLTLTSNEVDAITDAGNTLQITGESNDTLNVVGAVDTGQDLTVSGHVYDVYSFGNTLLYVEQNTVAVVN